ncbi:DUF6506 family protein [Clostridia bacterium OttesenSCG-928-F22]|nr:DUF6506 family protein [Clostridia bacterium OttesenSCG-928-F22]
MKKFAFVLMSPYYDPEKHYAHFETEQRDGHIVIVNDYEQAKKKIVELYKDGFGAIELCGGFGTERVRELIALTDNKMAIGYVVFDPMQAEVYEDYFGKPLAAEVTKR